MLINIKLTFIVLLLANTAFASNKPTPRIVSLTPHITEILISLDVGDNIVAVDNHSKTDGLNKDVARVGDVYLLDIEKVISLNPELIIAWASSNQKQVQSLQSLGYKVFLSNGQSIDEIISEIKAIGKIVNKQNNAKRLIETMQKEIATIKQTYQNKAVMRVFLPVWHKPLITLGGGQITSKALALCAAENIFDDNALLTLNITLESVIDKNPDGVLVQDADNQHFWQQLGLTTQHYQADELARMNHHYIDGIAKLCQAIDELRY